MFDTHQGVISANVNGGAGSNPGETGTLVFGMVPVPEPGLIMQLR